MKAKNNGKAMIAYLIYNNRDIKAGIPSKKELEGAYPGLQVIEERSDDTATTVVMNARLVKKLSREHPEFTLEKV